MVLVAKFVATFVLDNAHCGVYSLSAMGLIDFPDPVSMFESAKNAGLEREAANSFVSASYSAWISFVWRSGSSKWALWAGEGQAMKDAATSMYLSLSKMEAKGFLVLTVPQDLLAADNLSKFQSEWRTK
jgi:hypothetical protein